MNIHWKIFNVVNFICLTLVISCCARSIFAGTISADTLRGKLYYAFIITAILVVVINCLHVYLTRLCFNGERLTLTRQIFFWVQLVLFIGVMSLFIYYTSLEIYLRFRFTGGYKRMGGLRYFNQFLSISVSGLYIIVTQAILFFTTKRSYRQQLNNSIDKIGS